MFKIIKLGLRFARKEIVISMGALVLLGSIVGGNIGWKSIFAFIAVVSYLIHANSINDLADVEIDSVNFGKAPDRPLLEQKPGRDFWIVHLATGVLTLALSFLYGKTAVLLTLFFFFLSYIYSLKPIRLTDRTFASPLLLAVFYTYYPLSLGFLATEGHATYPWMLSIGIYMAFVGRMLLKDFRDVKGDKKFGKKTFLLQYGPDTTCAVSAFLYLSALLVVIYATNFAWGILLPLVVGMFSILLLLNDLRKIYNIKTQQRIIGFITNAGNFSIAVIFISLILGYGQTFNIFIKEGLPAFAGIAFLTLNLSKYMMQRSKLLGKLQRIAYE